MSLWGDEKRVPIKASVKKKVYKRAKGKCEVCGISLEMKHGDFHHTRDPKVSAMAKTVQFLCPTCHRKYGHKRVTRTELDWWDTRKVSKIVRQKVPKLKKTTTKAKSTSKKSKSTKKTIRSKNKSKKKSSSRKSKKQTSPKRKAPTRSRTKSGRFRKKRSDAGKKRK
ncbi:hypothetical protein KAU18_01860 [Candidatus Bathyarchaeota archaeon]|nr:hypothetical protein [Candidatus Bathyarchaeota archaeon]